MLRLRPYKACDAGAVVSWIGDERAFRKWSADRFGSWPFTAADLNRHYDALAGSDSFCEFTAFDDGGPVGHLIMRFTDERKTVLRFGFVIVDPSKRGQGLGKEMLGLALNMAFFVLKAEKVTLGVFENNPAAYYCYKAAGFRDAPREKPECFQILGETWNCRELQIAAPNAPA